MNNEIVETQYFLVTSESAKTNDLHVVTDATGLMHPITAAAVLNKVANDVEIWLSDKNKTKIELKWSSPER